MFLLNLWKEKNYLHFAQTGFEGNPNGVCARMWRFGAFVVSVQILSRTRQLSGSYNTVSMSMVCIKKEQRFLRLEGDRSWNLSVTQRNMEIVLSCNIKRSGILVLFVSSEINFSTYNTFWAEKLHYYSSFLLDVYIRATCLHWVASRHLSRS